MIISVDFCLFSIIQLVLIIYECCVYMMSLLFFNICIRHVVVAEAVNVRI